MKINLDNLADQVRNNVKDGFSRRAKKSEDELFAIAFLYFATDIKYPLADNGKLTGKAMVQLGFIKNEAQWSMYAKEATKGELGKKFSKWLENKDAIKKVVADYNKRIANLRGKPEELEEESSETPQVEETEQTQ
jgi:hypothetical protein